jgi:hypothetical protein
MCIGDDTHDSHKSKIYFTRNSHGHAYTLLKHAGMYMNHVGHCIKISSHKLVLTLFHHHPKNLKF